MDPTRERILRITTVLYRRHGFQGTSLSAVAKELGITSAALYYHFESKQEILFLAMRDSLIDLIGATRQSLTTAATPSDRLRQFVFTHVSSQLHEVELFGHTPYGVAQLMDHLTSAQQAELRELQRDQTRFLRDILTTGMRAGGFHYADPAAVAFAIFGMCEHVLHWYHPEGPLSVRELAELYADLAVRMAQVN